MNDPSGQPSAPAGELIAPPEPLPGTSKHPAPEGVAAAPALEKTASAGLLDMPGMDESAKQEFLWHTHQYLGEYARFGDTKAAFAGTVASALLGALYSAKAHVPMLQTRYDQWSVATWLAVAAGLFLFASVALAVWTIVPRLRSTQSKGLIYWGSIAAHKEHDLLMTSFHSQSARTLNDHLLHHAFDLSSKVLIPKYRTVSLALWAMAVGGFLAAWALMLQDAPRKPSPAVPPAAAAPARPAAK